MSSGTKIADGKRIPSIRVNGQPVRLMPVYVSPEVHAALGHAAIDNKTSRSALADSAIRKALGLKREPALAASA